MKNHEGESRRWLEQAEYDLKTSRYRGLEGFETMSYGPPFQGLSPYEHVSRITNTITPFLPLPHP
jgi:hypothetical protein